MCVYAYASHMHNASLWNSVSIGWHLDSSLLKWTHRMKMKQLNGFWLSAHSRANRTIECIVFFIPSVFLLLLYTMAVWLNNQLFWQIHMRLDFDVGKSISNGLVSTRFPWAIVICASVHQFWSNDALHWIWIYMSWHPNQICWPNVNANPD